MSYTITPEKEFIEQYGRYHLYATRYEDKIVVNVIGKLNTKAVTTIKCKGYSYNTLENALQRLHKELVSQAKCDHAQTYYFAQEFTSRPPWHWNNWFKHQIGPMHFHLESIAHDETYEPTRDDIETAEFLLQKHKGAYVKFIGELDHD